MTGVFCGAAGAASGARRLVRNISNSLTLRKPSSATNGRIRFLGPGTVHALPRRTQPLVRLVVDGRPPATRGDHRADAVRRHSVAGGKSSGCDPDRARPVPLL